MFINYLLAHLQVRMDYAVVCTLYNNLVNLNTHTAILHLISISQYAFFFFSFFAKNNNTCAIQRKYKKKSEQIEIRGQNYRDIKTISRKVNKCVSHSNVRYTKLSKDWNPITRSVLFYVVFHTENTRITRK